MSFSGKVKEELSRQIGGARHCQLAELSAFVIFCGTIRMDEEGAFALEIQTEHGPVIDKVMILLKKCFQLTPTIHVIPPNGRRKKEQYFIGVQNRDDVHRILLALKVIRPNGELTDERHLCQRTILQKQCCRRAFLRGAFIAAGSISDPNRSYHFEIVCGGEEMAGQLCDMLGELGVPARFVQRNRYQVIYIKESELISDLLTMMDARVSLLDFENIRIVREMRGNVNRKVNCETANINKTANAAVRQIEDIRYIEQTIGFSELSNGLDEMAKIRLQYPEANLRELGELMDPPVGKSGVNHRLRKLSRIADDLRGKKEAVTNG